MPKNDGAQPDEDIVASTVDSIQGKENDIVIYDLTWVHPDGSGKIAYALADFRRLNVALTRAKKKLIVIGDLHKLSGQYPYCALADYLKNNCNAVLAPFIPDNDDFLTFVEGCFSEKKKAVDHCLAQKMQEAKKRLSQEVRPALGPSATSAQKCPICGTTLRAVYRNLRVHKKPSRCSKFWPLDDPNENCVCGKRDFETVEETVLECPRSGHHTYLESPLRGRIYRR